MSKTAAVLDLKTTTAASAVKIDGQVYRLKSPNEFSYQELRAFERDAPRALALIAKGPGIANDAATELCEALDRIARSAVDAPAKVHDKLSVMHLGQIFKAVIDQAEASGAITRAAATGPKQGPRSGRRSRR